MISALTSLPTTPNALAKDASRFERALSGLAGLQLKTRDARVVAQLRDLGRRRKLESVEGDLVWLLVNKHSAALDDPARGKYDDPWVTLSRAHCERLDLRERVAALRLYDRLCKAKLQSRLF